MKKKIFQVSIEKNGPIAGPEMESCPRQCTVCPDAMRTATLSHDQAYFGNVVSIYTLLTSYLLQNCARVAFSSQLAECGMYQCSHVGSNSNVSVLTGGPCI